MLCRRSTNEVPYSCYITHTHYLFNHPHGPPSDPARLFSAHPTEALLTFSRGLWHGPPSDPACLSSAHPTEALLTFSQGLWHWAEE